MEFFLSLKRQKYKKNEHDDVAKLQTEKVRILAE